MDLRKVNKYSRNVTAVERLLKLHRKEVGGFWDEVGKLQFDFLVTQGLKPESTLLDVGCGALRGGVHAVRYLDDGKYYGVDVNAGLLKAGRQELKAAGLNKQVHLSRTDFFDATEFGVTFDFGISVSLFTHLTANQIIYCMAQMRRVMHPESRFYATFFEIPELVIPDEFDQGPLVTHFLGDPFHYTQAQMVWMAESVGLAPRYIGDWDHPRGQKMMEFLPA